MITLAIPNKGRLYKKTIELLERAGIRLPENGRKLYVRTNIEKISVIFARAQDIPWYVASEAADIGITGEDTIRESGAVVEKMLKLNFGNCTVALASENGQRKRIATKLPNITRTFFPDATIIPMNGSCEVAPKLGIADAIVDQVSSGDTLKANNLKVDQVLFESYIYLIGNKNSVKKKEVEELMLGFQGVLTAEEKRYIMFNVTREEELAAAIKVTPAMESPTVLKLAKSGCYSIHSVVDIKDLMPALRRIKQAGGKDILVLNMSRVVP